MLGRGHALARALLTGALLSQATPAQSPRLGPTAAWLAHAPRMESTANQTRAPYVRLSARRPQNGDASDGTAARSGAWVSLAAGLISASLACKFDVDARAEYDDRNDAYVRYQGAYTSEGVHYWRDLHHAAERRGDAAILRRNLASGVALAGIGVGLALWIWW